jgi:uncharacterized repeat protein (TIGR01451 family)
MFGASFRARTWLSAVAAAAFACALFLGAISPVAAQDPDPPLPPSADLTVTKTGPATASANSNVTYTIAILNIGPEDALNALLSDPLPGGMTFVSLSTPSSWTCTTPAVGSGGTVTCTNPNFTSGSSASFSLTLNIPAGTPGGTFFTNIATVSSAVFDVNDENNSSTAVTLVTGAASADMFVTKAGPATIVAGQNIAYSIQAGNAGPDAATGVSLSDTLPGDITFVSLTSPPGWTCTTPAVGAGGTVTCTIPAFAAGASANFTLTANVPGGTQEGTFYQNAATISSQVPDPTTENNEAVAGTLVVSPSPDLAIAKSHSGNAAQGQTGFVYTLTVTNAGSAPTTGTTTVQDILPAGLTATAISGSGWNCTLATLTCDRADALAAAAAYPVITLTVNVAANAPPAVVNTATVANTGDTNPANDTALDVTNIVPVAPDLAIAKTHSGNAQQGQIGFVYTITVQNVGNAATSGLVTVSDTLPAGLTATGVSGGGWSCSGGATPTCTRSDALGAGASYPPITLTVNVAANAPANITNTATVSGGGDINTANNTASDPTLVVPAGGGADLAIAKTHAGNARAGQIGFVYTITVNNVGTIASSGTVTVTDLLPPKLTATAISGAGWACSLGATPSCSRSDALAPNASYPPISLTVNVAGDAPPIITNTATVSGGSDFNPANNTATDQTTVRPRADPTKDPDVVGLVTAQIATAQRFANTQISNFNERLEALHDENTGDQFGLRFGSPEQDQCYIPGTTLLRDPFDPKCQRPNQYVAEASATDAFASMRTRKAPANRPPPPAPRTRDFAFWSTGYVSFGSADPTLQRSSIDFNTSGVSAGVDYRLSGNLIAGIGVGYGRDSTKIGDRGTHSDAEAYNVAAYGSYRPFRNLFIDGLAGYGAMRFNSQRFVVDDAALVYGARTGNQFFGSLTAAYQFRFDGLMLSPYARIKAAWLTLDAFTETGGLGGALTYSAQTANFYTSVLGLRGKYTFRTDWGSITPRFRVEYNHDFAGASTIFLQYADLIGPIYSLTTSPAGRDRATFGAGTDLMIGDTHRFAFDYQYDVDFLGADWHRFKLRWETRFQP